LYKKYSATNTFPPSENFGRHLNCERQQFLLLPKIAEGASRSSKKDFSRFLEISIGSTYEVETQLIIANDLGMIEEKAHDGLNNQLAGTIKQMKTFKNVTPPQHLKSNIFSDILNFALELI